MASEARYAAAGVWDTRYRVILAAGEPDRSSLWLAPFLPLLPPECRAVLDLGCGTGFDAIALSRRGYEVEGIDHAQVAIDQAVRLAQEAGLAIGFRQGDIALPLPYPDGAFHAVISNLVLHSFGDAVLQRILSEVDRCLRPGGLLLFHANAIEDLERRLAVQPAERPLGRRAFVLDGGQTMYFRDRADWQALLADWLPIVLEPVTHRDSLGNAIKSVWRCAVRKRP